MTVTSARYIVAPAKVTPLPYGLLSVAQPDDELDPHWQMGVQFQPNSCAAVTAVGGPCVAPTSKTPTQIGLPVRAADPFTVYAWIDCSPGGGFLEEAKERTTAALTGGEGRGVEEEFWTGEAGTLPHLAANAEVDDGSAVLQTAATVLTAGAADPIEAFALLEGALGDCYGGVGVIHVPLGALAHLRSEGVLQYLNKGDSQVLSWGGHRVAVGAGYPGTAPDGSTPAAGDTWLYATGAVRYWRSEISVDTAPGIVVGRSKNDMVMIAERTYVLAWDCCHFAAQVRLGGEAVGAVGGAG